MGYFRYKQKTLDLSVWVRVEFKDDINMKFGTIFITVNIIEI